VHPSSQPSFAPSTTEGLWKNEFTTDIADKINIFRNVSSNESSLATQQALALVDNVVSETVPIAFEDAYVQQFNSQ
jgi:hypothetical protein